jgi:hypothetical protein
MLMDEAMYGLVLYPYTPPPLPVAVLPLIFPPLKVKNVLFTLAAYIPPPLTAVLPLISPPDMVKGGLPEHVPPPLPLAVLTQIKTVV